MKNQIYEYLIINHKKYVVRVLHRLLKSSIEPLSVSIVLSYYFSTNIYAITFITYYKSSFLF